MDKIIITTGNAFKPQRFWDTKEVLPKDLAKYLKNGWVISSKNKPRTLILATIILGKQKWPKTTVLKKVKTRFYQGWSSPAFVYISREVDKEFINLTKEGLITFERGKPLRINL